MSSYTDEDFKVTAVDGNRYDLRQVKRIKPVDAKSYWKADIVDLLLRDGTVVRVDKGDLTGDEWVILDQCYDPM